MEENDSQAERKKYLLFFHSGPHANSYSPWITGQTDLGGTLSFTVLASREMS